MCLKDTEIHPHLHCQGVPRCPWERFKAVVFGVQFCSLIGFRGVDSAVQFTCVVIVCYMPVFVYVFPLLYPNAFSLFMPLNDSGVRSDRQSSYMNF